MNETEESIISTRRSTVTEHARRCSRSSIVCARRLSENDSHQAARRQREDAKQCDLIKAQASNLSGTWTVLGDRRRTPRFVLIGGSSADRARGKHAYACNLLNTCTWLDGWRWVARAQSSIICMVLSHFAVFYHRFVSQDMFPRSGLAAQVGSCAIGGGLVSLG